MERKIKFRAFDNDPDLGYPEMYDWERLNKLDADGLIHFCDIIQGSERHITLMQFTGLTDKNGKDIYEGDILNAGDPNIKYVVEWFDCGLQARQLKNKSTIGITHWAEKITVMGNIYENPELLK